MNFIMGSERNSGSPASIKRRFDLRKSAGGAFAFISACKQEFA
jgi:hypothetical protein